MNTGSHQNRDGAQDDDARSEMHMEELQHLVDEAKNMMNDPGMKQQIMEMNLKLREDLTKAFESYIQLLTRCDKLQRDKIQLNYELAKLRETHETKSQSLEKRIQIMEKAIEERDRAHQSVIDTYEARITRARTELKKEKEEKLIILRDFNELKEKYYQEAKATPETQQQELLAQKATMMIKLDKMGAELDSYKLRLIENEIKAKRETLERLEISNAKRIKTKYRRMKFIGEPKSFQEILNLMSGMESFPLKSKERMAALEEFCIYANSNEENLEKLRTLNGARHAAKSLASTDASIVVRALVFAAMLSRNNSKISEALLEHGALNYLVEYLNSSNENFRVESLNVLQQLSEFPLAQGVFNKFQILSRVVILLEEGLQMKNDVGFEQAISSVKIIRNYVKVQATEKATYELHNQGAVQTLCKCFFSQDKVIRKIAIEILASIQLSDEVTIELANLGMISLTLKLMQQQEYSTQINATKLFKNISDRSNILAEIIQNENLENLIDGVNKSSTKEVKLLYLDALYNLSLISECVPELCRHGLLNTLSLFFSQIQDIEVIRASARVIDQISQNGILIDLVYKSVKFNDLVSNMNPFKDLELSKYSLHIAKTFSKYQRMQNELIKRRKEIIEFLMDCLRDQELHISQKRRALQLVPFLIAEPECLEIFTKLRIEESLADMLGKCGNTNDKVLAQILKSLIMMHASTISLSPDSQVGRLFLDKQGLKLLLSLLEDRVNEDTHNINWKVLLRLAQTLFVLCFKERNLRVFREEHIISRLVDALIKAQQQNVTEVVVSIIKLLTFFSDDQTTWSQIICREVVKGCMHGLLTKEKIEKKFLVALLYDISTSPITLKIIKEIPWPEGIGRLVNNAFADEPLAVSLIIGNFNRDVVIRNQLITMMQRDQISDILTARQEKNEWMDLQIPAHVKRMRGPYSQGEVQENNANIFQKLIQQNMANMEYKKLVEKPPSQMTMRSGITINRHQNEQRKNVPTAQLMLNYDSKSKDVIPLLNNQSVVEYQAPDRKFQIGLTAHNLEMLNEPKKPQELGLTKQNFVKNFLNQLDSNATERQKVQNRMRAVSNLRGDRANFNNVDQNLDLAPFDSVSNPNKSVRHEPRMASNKRLLGGLRPEMDSFYKDRDDIKQKQGQQRGSRQQFY